MRSLYKILILLLYNSLANKRLSKSIIMIVTMQPIGNSTRICPFIPQRIQPHVNPICAFDTSNQFSIEPLNICFINATFCMTLQHVAKLQNIILLLFNLRLLVAQNVSSTKDWLSSQELLSKSKLVKFNWKRKTVWVSYN